MGVIQRVVKASTRRGKLALEKRAPKVHENVKSAMFIKGGNTSQLITEILREIHMLKKPHAVMYKKKNITRPFEDLSTLEFFSDKADASLFMFGSHSKKRPNNLVLGRMFGHHVLDMVEFGVEDFKSMNDFEVAKCTVGTKPSLQFVGELFENDDEFKRLKNLLLDFFRGETLQKIRLDGIEHVLQFVAVNGKILLRSYRTLLKKSGSKTPRIELVEIGPSLDLNVRRKHLASTDLYKKACKQPKAAKIKVKKNISQDVFGRKMGRIHMTPQDLNKLQTRKVKALKKRQQEERNEEKETTGSPSDSPTPKKRALEGTDKRRQTKESPRKRLKS